MLLRLAPRNSRIAFVRRNRLLTTLAENKHIFVFPQEDELTARPKGFLLSLLSSSSALPQLALGFTPSVPPDPSTFQENPKFFPILDATLAEWACKDKGVVSQASAMASSAGAALGSGGIHFPQAGSSPQRRRGGPNAGSGGGGGAGGDGAGGVSGQGGAGSGGRGGYIHVYDERHPPDFGRIPDPEDIYGSLEVDGRGNFVDGHGRYQSSGSYRILTRDGILGLSSFLREKLVDRLKLEEAILRK